VRPRDRAALLLVALAVTFSVLAVGGAPRWAACIGALLGVASAAPYITSRRTASKPSPLLLPLAVAAGLTALQLLPLPIAIAEQLVPAKLELVSANAAALDEPAPTWVMASYDPPATLVELAKLLGYLGLAYTCVRLATVRRARRALAELVAGVATLAALVTLVHHALGATSLYGMFEPEVRPHILGPLFGVNHLAALLSIATPIALALALASTGILRVSWLTAAATLAGTTLLTGSRGGALGLVAGLVVVIALLMVQRRAGTDEGRRVSLAVSLSGFLIAGCAVVLLALLTAGDVASDLSRTQLAEIHESHSKFQVWDRTTTLVPEHRWLGVGKGGFEAAFTGVSQVGDLTYTHAENSYLQAVIDWGLPGAALLALALATAARAAIGRWRHGPLDAGALAGIATLAVHDIADFSTEIPAVAMLVLTAAAMILPARLGADTDVKTAPQRLLVSRAGLIAAATLLIALAATPVGRSMRADDVIVAAVSEAERLAIARKAWSRHPSDYLLAGRVAEALFIQRDPRAGRVVGRGLAMNPLHSGLHHLAARMLARSDHPEQATVEFAAAARWAVNIKPIVDDVLLTFGDADMIARALPAEPRQLGRVVDALGERHDAAFAFARRVAELHPLDPEAQYTLGWTALRARHIEIAVSAAREAMRLSPGDLRATVLAQALGTAGDLPSAIATLEEALSGTESSAEPARFLLLFTLVDLQVAASDLSGARETLERVTAVANGKPEMLIRVHERLADVEDRLGNLNQAEWERREANRLRELAPQR